MATWGVMSDKGRLVLGGEDKTPSSLLLPLRSNYFMSPRRSYTSFLLLYFSITHIHTHYFFSAQYTCFPFCYFLFPLLLRQNVDILLPSVIFRWICFLTSCYPVDGVIFSPTKTAYKVTLNLNTKNNVYIVIVEKSGRIDRWKDNKEKGKCFGGIKKRYEIEQ